MNTPFAPGISVVIPLFNKQDYIIECLKSALNQDYSTYEIIVIDDGSTDNGPELVKNINDSKIKMLQQKNAGVSEARNRGVQESKYELISFLDADDVWLPGHLHSLAKLAETYPNTACWSTGFQFKSKQSSKIYSITKKMEYFSFENFIATLLSGKKLVHTSAAMVKKTSFMESKGFMKGFNHGEDEALWLTLAHKHGVAVCSSVNAVYNCGIVNSLNQRLCKEQDACTVTIEQLLESDLNLSQKAYEMLRELRCQKALAHTINAMIHGDKKIACFFLEKAKDTKKYRLRRRQLQFMLLLDGKALLLATQFMIAAKESGNTFVMTAKNIVTNFLNPRFTIVILKKILGRLTSLFKNETSYHEWYVNKSQDIELYKDRINLNLYKEAVTFHEEFTAKANTILATIPVKLGGACFCTLLYYTVRIIKPEITVETGVAAGFSSQTILSALKQNGRGKLYSSDLPYFRIQNPEKYVGVVVDNALKSNWLLLLDGDEKNLNSIKHKLGDSKIALLHYDSDKSYSGRNRALEILDSNFCQDTIFIFDDISDNSHFHDWVLRKKFEFRIFHHNSKYIGLASKNNQLLNLLFPSSS